MLTLSEKAKEVLDQHFADKDKEPLRIYIASSCGGSRLTLGVDSAKEGDKTITLEGYDFVIDEELLEQAKPVAIDHNPMGIEISSSLVFEEEQSGGCGSCCGGCG